MEAVTKISDVAGKEYTIEQTMDKMEGEWENVCLDIAPNTLTLTPYPNPNPNPNA